jgi:hypothetical protein
VDLPAAYREHLLERLQRAEHAPVRPALLAAAGARSSPLAHRAVGPGPPAWCGLGPLAWLPRAAPSAHSGGARPSSPRANRPSGRGVHRRALTPE